MDDLLKCKIEDNKINFDKKINDMFLETMNKTSDIVLSEGKLLKGIMICINSIKLDIESDHLRYSPRILRSEELSNITNYEINVMISDTFESDKILFLPQFAEQVVVKFEN